MAEVTVEIDSAESVCTRCGARALRRVHAAGSSRMHGLPGPERLVATNWQNPDGWEHFRALGVGGDLCPRCARFVTGALYEAANFPPEGAPPREVTYNGGFLAREVAEDPISVHVDRQKLVTTVELEHNKNGHRLAVRLSDKEVDLLVGLLETRKKRPPNG